MQRNAKFQGKKNFGFLEYKCNELQKSSSSVSRRSSGLEWVILLLFANTKSQKSNSINCTGDQAMINRYKSLCRSINICINRDGAVLLPGVLNAEWLKYMTKWVKQVYHVWIWRMKVWVFQNSDRIIGQGGGGQSVQPLSWLHPLSPTWWGFESISAMITVSLFCFSLDGNDGSRRRVYLPSVWQLDCVSRRVWYNWYVTTKHEY